MEELRRLLSEIGVDSSELEEGHRVRQDLALESSETVELEECLRSQHDVVVNLWDVHDYTLGELRALIEARG